MADILQWSASISGMIAALIVAADLGRRRTGWGFVLFTLSSLCWIAGGFLAGEAPVSVQNIVLLAVNLFGVWRYLLAKRAD